MIPAIQLVYFIRIGWHAAVIEDVFLIRKDEKNRLCTEVSIARAMNLFWNIPCSDER
jgi:hypothetical protein